MSSRKVGLAGRQVGLARPIINLRPVVDSIWLADASTFKYKYGYENIFVSPM